MCSYLILGQFCACNVLIILHAGRRCRRSCRIITAEVRKTDILVVAHSRPEMFGVFFLIIDTFSFPVFRLFYSVVICEAGIFFKYSKGVWK